MKCKGDKVVATPVERTDSKILVAFVGSRAAHGPTIYTDAASDKLANDRNQYRHEIVNHSGREYVLGAVRTNRIEST